MASTLPICTSEPRATRQAAQPRQAIATMLFEKSRSRFQVEEQARLIYSDPHQPPQARCGGPSELWHSESWRAGCSEDE